MIRPLRSYINISSEGFSPTSIDYIDTRTSNEQGYWRLSFANDTFINLHNDGKVVNGNKWTEREENKNMEGGMKNV